MPRHALLDSPGLLQHVIVRGIAGADIFADDDDRGRFVARLRALLLETGSAGFAWALTSNHFHLLLSCTRLARVLFISRLPTGYAGTFNERHGQRGHLFQYRYNFTPCAASSHLDSPRKSWSAAFSPCRQGHGKDEVVATNTRTAGGVCCLGVRELGDSGALVGTLLGMGSSSVCRAARRGEELLASWSAVSA